MNVRVIFCLLGLLTLGIVGCDNPRSQSEVNDRNFVDRQQQQYQSSQALEFYDWSVPRDVYQQIYKVVTTQKVTTYTVIETMTGELRYSGPSIGYPIPADTSLTNPLQPYSSSNDHGLTTIEQAEPNGLFPSKNTDATWILFVDQQGGTVYPVYTELKVTTWPFIVQRTEKGEWKKVSGKTPEFTISVRTKSSGK